MRFLEVVLPSQLYNLYNYRNCQHHNLYNYSYCQYHVHNMYTHSFTRKLAQPCEPDVRSVRASHAPAWLKKAIVTLDGTPWVWRRLKEDIVVWQPQLGSMVQPCAT